MTAAGSFAKETSWESKGGRSPCLGSLSTGVIQAGDDRGALRVGREGRLGLGLGWVAGPILGHSESTQSVSLEPSTPPVRRVGGSRGPGCGARQSHL